MPQSVRTELLEMYYAAVAAGVSANEFWETTPFEIGAAIAAFRQRQGELQQQFWQLGKLVGLAVNNPSAYPLWSEVMPMKDAGDMEQSCRALAAAMGGDIKVR